ncbi:hypothetical protein [Kribbella deserti]|uniref:Uncharacterized protein n=1 Tax=Kribbella deserti TaxID=1926257 RepID=A0ABV6QQZ2_9ACTN
MKPSRPWLYGGGLYVVTITVLMATAPYAGPESLYGWTLLASLPLGVVAYLLTYCTFVAGLLLGFDPTSSPLYWLPSAPVWTVAATGNVAAAWFAWTDLRSTCFPRLQAHLCPRTTPATP